jgi:hypothetical protein
MNAYTKEIAIKDLFLLVAEMAKETNTWEELKKSVRFQVIYAVLINGGVI